MDEITRAKRITADQASPEVAHAAQQLVAEAVAFWEFDPAVPGQVSLVLSEDPATVLLEIRLSEDELEVCEVMRNYA